MSKNEYDVEAAKETSESSVDIQNDGAVHAETFEMGTGLVGKLQRLAGRFGVEQRGIERVPADERLNDGMSTIGTLVSCTLLV